MTIVFVTAISSLHVFYKNNHWVEWMNQSCIQGQKKIDNERNKTQSWKLKVLVMWMCVPKFIVKRYPNGYSYHSHKGVI